MTQPKVRNEQKFFVMPKTAGSIAEAKVWAFCSDFSRTLTRVPVFPSFMVYRMRL
jgi:hypothetical protein